MNLIENWFHHSQKSRLVVPCPQKLILAISHLDNAPNYLVGCVISKRGRKISRIAFSLWILEHYVYATHYIIGHSRIICRWKLRKNSEKYPWNGIWNNGQLLHCKLQLIFLLPHCIPFLAFWTWHSLTFHSEHKNKIKKGAI